MNSYKNSNQPAMRPSVTRSVDRAASVTASAASVTATVLDGWLFVGGIKVCRVESGTLILKDKDRRRSAERGTPLVEVTPDEIVEAVNRALARHVEAQAEDVESIHDPDN